jgi:hypothetical protein
LVKPAVGDPFRGRHVAVAIGWDARTKAIIIENSWGPAWGDNGVGYIEKGYFDNHVDSVTLFRPTWLGPSPAFDAKLREMAWRKGTPREFTPESYVSAWATPNRIMAKNVELDCERYLLQMRITYSVARSRTIEVVELRHDKRLCGRLHVAHDFPADGSVILELWVPPNQRRRQYGTYLESLASGRAKGRGAGQIYLELHEADAGPAGLKRSLNFGEKVGYQWDPTPGRRPRIFGIASKSLI